METDIEQRLKMQRRTELRRFGFSFGSGMAILAILGLWKDFDPPLIITAALLSVFHFGGAFFWTQLLQPTYTVVSVIGKILGWIITVVVFTPVYYLIFTPLALLVRLCHKDVIADNSRRPAWIAVSEKHNDPQRITRLF